MNTTDVATPELKVKCTTIRKREKQATELEGRGTHWSLNNAPVWQVIPMGQSTPIII